MMQPFGTAYSGVYDRLYSSKDYQGECDLIERILSEHSNPGRTILDLGCGTGNHAIPLAQRGHEMLGVDRSQGMLDAARGKSASQPGVSFASGDVRTVRLDRRFDAVIMMFAVLGYQCTNADLMATLDTVRRHLDKGGLFIFDIWYGPAVLIDRPGQRTRIIDTDTGRIIRTTDSVLDVNVHRCTVTFHVLSLEGNQVVAEDREEHSMRYFFPLELELALSQAGLSLTALRAFPDYDTPIGEGSWNAIAVARAV